MLNAEWYDPQACITRPFFIQFYPFDGAIDIVSSDKHLKMCVLAVRYKAKAAVPEADQASVSDAAESALELRADDLHAAV